MVIVNKKPTKLATTVCLTETHCHILIMRGRRFNNRVAVAGRVIGCPNMTGADNERLASAVQRRTRNFNTRFLLTRIATFRLSKSIGAIGAKHKRCHYFNILLTANTRPHVVNFPNRTRFHKQNMTCYTAYSNRFFANGRIFIVNNNFTTTRRDIFLAHCTGRIAVLVHRRSFAYTRTISHTTGRRPGVAILSRATIIRTANSATLQDLQCESLEAKRRAIFTPRKSAFNIFIFTNCRPRATLVQSGVRASPENCVIASNSRQADLRNMCTTNSIYVGRLQRIIATINSNTGTTATLRGCTTTVRRGANLHPQGPRVGRAGTTSNNRTRPRKVFPRRMVRRLRTMFREVRRPLVLRLYLSRGTISRRLHSCVRRLTQLAPGLAMEGSARNTRRVPLIHILHSSNDSSNLTFRKMPNKRRFASFVVKLCGITKPKRTLSKRAVNQVGTLSTPASVRVFISLSYAVYPRLIVRTRRVTTLGPGIETRTCSLGRFPTLGRACGIVDMPYLILGNRGVLFKGGDVDRLLSALRRRRRGDHASSQPRK